MSYPMTASAAAWSALDAYPRPVASLRELWQFMDDAGESVPSRLMLDALEGYVRTGAVLAVWGGAEIRYALRSRLIFRRNYPPPRRPRGGGPWAA